MGARGRIITITLYTAQEVKINLPYAYSFRSRPQLKPRVLDTHSLKDKKWVYTVYFTLSVFLKHLPYFVEKYTAIKYLLNLFLVSLKLKAKESKGVR